MSTHLVSLTQINIAGPIKGLAQKVIGKSGSTAVGVVVAYLFEQSATLFDLSLAGFDQAQLVKGVGYLATLRIVVNDLKECTFRFVQVGFRRMQLAQPIEIGRASCRESVYITASDGSV